MPRTLDSQAVKKLLVRVPNWIGDAVMAAPALRAIRTTFPSAEIILACNPLVAELFSPHPSCDRVLVYDKEGVHAGLLGKLRFARCLRRERIDLAILLQNAFEAALLAFLGRSVHRLGYSTDGRRLLLTHPVQAVDKKHGLHHVDYYLEMLRQQGIVDENSRLELYLTDEERKWAAAALPGSNWLVINPGASYGAAKRWFPDRFATVAKNLAARHGLKPVLTGGSGEAAIGADIEELLQGNVRNLIGQTSLRQLMAILQRSRLMITNDSGPMHLGAALGTPMVAIFGPTDHRTTSPRTESWRLVRHPVDCSPCLLRTCPIDHRCMVGVDAKMVIAAAEELLTAQT